MFFRKIRNEKLIKNNELKVLTQKIISIYSAKGGVGRTSITLHLAKYLEKIKPLLIDLNFSNGPSDISFYLNLPRVPHLSNFIMDIEEPERAFKNCLIKPNLHEFDVIQAPPTIRQSNNVSISSLITLLDIAKTRYGVIIFDIPDRYDDLIIHLINTSTNLILVTTDEPGSVARLKELEDLLFGNPKSTIVFNKYKKGSLIKVKEMEDYFSKKIVSIGYDDRLTYRMQNKILRTDDSVLFGEGINNLVKTLID